VQVLDSKIEQDREFYDYLVQYPKFIESGDFSRIVKEHEGGYAGRMEQRQEMERQKAAEEDARKIEAAKRKEKEDFLRRVEDGKNSLTKIEALLHEVHAALEQARAEEETQMRKRFGKDFSEALVLYRKAQTNGDDAERMCLKTLDVFKQAMKEFSEFDSSLLAKVEKLAADARQSYSLANEKLAALRR